MQIMNGDSRLFWCGQWVECVVVQWGLSAGAVLPDSGGMPDRAAIPDFDLFPSQNTVVSLPVLLPINYLYRKLYE